MKPFIKATEVWVPSRRENKLEYSGGFYGQLSEFQALSEGTTFQYDQGLPGKAWAAKHPLVLTEFNDSYFERTEAAHASGITAGIALPIFAGSYLMGVILFLCGDDEQNVGAIEVWHCDTNQSYDLQLMDGYFGTLDHFEFLARNTLFRKGTGLPGMTWEQGKPVLMSDLGASRKFIRSSGATEAGITTGLGIPCHYDPEQIYILAMLSAQGTPIARQIEFWVPDQTGEFLQFDTGYSEQGIELGSTYDGHKISKSDGSIGACYRNGIPIVSWDVGQSGAVDVSVAQELNFSSVTLIPVLENGRCRTVVALYS